MTLGNAVSSIVGLVTTMPKVVESHVDVRHDLDRTLKTTCEAFIMSVTKPILAPLTSFMLKARPGTRHNPTRALILSMTRYRRLNRKVGNARPKPRPTTCPPCVRNRSPTPRPCPRCTPHSSTPSRRPSQPSRPTSDCIFMMLAWRPSSSFPFRQASVCRHSRRASLTCLLQHYIVSTYRQFHRVVGNMYAECVADGATDELPDFMRDASSGDCDTLNATLAVVLGL